jgi:glutamate dehydrogenase
LQLLTDAYLSVSKLAAKEKMNMRDAAYVIAVSRVAEACQERGWV